MQNIKNKQITTLKLQNLKEGKMLFILTSDRFNHKTQNFAQEKQFTEIIMNTTPQCSIIYMSRQDAAMSYQQRTYGNIQI
jgi:hypothetical protein